MFNYSKRGIFPLVLVVFAVLAVIIGGGLFIRQYFLKTPPIQQAELSLNTQNQNIEIADWKTYTNEKYQIAFQYPPIFSLDTGFDWNYFNWDDWGG